MPSLSAPRAAFPAADIRCGTETDRPGRPVAALLAAVAREAFGELVRLLTLASTLALAVSIASFSGFQWPTTANTGMFVGCSASGGESASRIACGGRNEKLSPSEASRLGRPPECAVEIRLNRRPARLARPDRFQTRRPTARDRAQLPQVDARHSAAGRQASVDPQEAAVGNLQQAGILPGDLQFEPHPQALAAALLPVAADAVQLLAVERDLVPQPRGDAGAPLELVDRLHQQPIAGRRRLVVAVAAAAAAAGAAATDAPRVSEPSCAVAAVPAMSTTQRR